MRARGSLVVLVATMMFLSSLIFISFSNDNVSATTPMGFIGVSGTNFTKDGTPFTTDDRLIGVDDTTVWTFANRAYCEGISTDWGKNMNFPSEGGQITGVSTLTQLWNSYFWYVSYYDLNLVRFSSGDDWATMWCYQAWLNHPTQYYAVLEEMMHQASDYGIYIILNMAGSQEYPVYNFAGTGTVFTLDHSTGTAYNKYLAYINATMIYCDSSAYTNAIFSYDVWNEPDHNLVNTGYWSGNQVAFRTWAKEVANDTVSMSTHIVEMGVAGQSNLFGWGYNSFYNVTGSIGFDVCDRHYYANIETDDYLIHDPIGWANTSGKPLVWSELGKSITPLTRWAWFEGELVSHGAKVWCNMVLTGTIGYPYVVIPQHSMVTSIVLYYNTNVIANFTDDSQAVTIGAPKSITEIQVNIQIAGLDYGFDIDIVVHLIGTPSYSDLTYSIGIDGYANGTVYNVVFNKVLSSPFALDQPGLYEVITENSYRILNTSSPINFQRWDDAIIYGSTLSPGAFIPDRFSIGANVLYFAWLLIIFLPGMILNSVLPKIGFIAGILITSIALTATNVIDGWWVLLTILMGVTILIYRGDEN